MTVPLLPIQNMPPTALREELQKYARQLQESIDSNNLEIQTRFQNLAAQIDALDVRVTALEP
jgi:polyhydroxyalkanoate synthesis regulator phasin